ncbi:hypothetical protein [Burkholderia sp. BDU5]|nr:hypothetical protein [Burkholderia sp. BDU5]
MQARLALHEASMMRRAYPDKAERLIRWAFAERGQALSKLTTKDEIAYHA